jgi:hypothetical protein
MEQGLPFNPMLLIPLFLIAFACFWLAITAILGVASGWFRLQRAFPDHMEQPIERLRFQSGAMGGAMPANFGSCLTLDICATGLRVSVLRLLGPFQRPFFVPWSRISVSRRRILFRSFCELSFGMPAEGNLLLRERTARRIAARGTLRLPPV